MPRRRHNRQRRRQRIDAHLVAPRQIDVLDVRNRLIDSLVSRRTIGKHKMAIYRHVKDWRVEEKSAPRGGTVMGDIARHGLHEAAYGHFDSLRIWLRMRLPESQADGSAKQNRKADAARQTTTHEALLALPTG